jgi:tetratricopeptide (TPR) repeat protein
MSKQVLNKRLLTMIVGVSLFVLMGSGSLRAQEVANELPPQAPTSEVERLKSERGEFVKEIRRVENLNKKYTQEIEEIKGLLAEKDTEFQARMKQMEEKISAENNQKAKEEVIVQKSEATTQELAQKTNEMLSKGGDLDPEDQQFKEELAKAHYNMGNIYYERGEYQRAVVEYYQAVDLTPNDPDTHYNLAFVSGEYLGDPETALKHYQWYLYLRPNAEDSPRVKEKIIQAKMYMRTKIDSPLDKDNGHFNLAR